MTDNGDDLFAQLGDVTAPDMLVITETVDGGDVHDPSGELDADRRIAMLWRALLTESADTIVDALAMLHEDNDDE